MRISYAERFELWGEGDLNHIKTPPATRTVFAKKILGT
jgi:hypothetical protein